MTDRSCAVFIVSIGTYNDPRTDGLFVFSTREKAEQWLRAEGYTVKPAPAEWVAINPDCWHRPGSTDEADISEYEVDEQVAEPAECE